MEYIYIALYGVFCYFVGAYRKEIWGFINPAYKQKQEIKNKPQEVIKEITIQDELNIDRVIKLIKDLSYDRTKKGFASNKEELIKQIKNITNV